MRLKKKRNKNTRKAAQKPESHNNSAAKLVDMDRWWAELSPEDKQFVHKIGLMTQAFKAGLIGNLISGTEGTEQALLKMHTLFEQVAGVAKKKSAKWPQNSPERRGLN